MLQAAIAGDLRRDQMRVADNLVVRVRQLIDADDVFLRYDEYVRRRAGLDVFKGEDLLVSKKLKSGYREIKKEIALASRPWRYSARPWAKR